MPIARVGRLSVVALLLTIVSCGGDSSTAPAPVATLSIAPMSGTVMVGATLPLVVTAQDARGNSTRAPVTLTSADTNRATVSSAAIVTGVGTGAVTITASANGHVATTQLTVLAVADAWTTYGHDGSRAAASVASVSGPLALAWSYTPTGVSGHPVTTVLYSLGTTDAVYLRQSLSSGYGYGLSPAVDRVTAAGAHVWTFNMGTDADFGNWASIRGNRFVMNDDGFRYVDLASGVATHSNGVDSWGETLSDSSAGVFTSNNAQIDGPGVFVANYDSAFHATWSANKFSKCRGAVAALAGGLALHGGVIFYAPNYNVGQATITLPFASGVFAIDASTGAQLAFHASTPFSHISADGSKVYLIENGSTLIALTQSGLQPAWTATLANPGDQAPVIADNMVIVATATGVEAHDVSTGAKVWSTTLTGASARFGTTYQGGNCGTMQIPEAYGATTTLAAALGSKSLVVTASDGIHILSLADGTDRWHGPIAGVPSGVGNPIIVNDPTIGATIYVSDRTKLYAVRPPVTP